MSTYLALTFGTLLSSQGTDTSFRPPSSGPSGRFVLSCFQLIRSSRPFLPALFLRISRWRDFLRLRHEAYQSFRCARSAGFASSEGAHFVKRARLDSAVS
ncbi:hypothetical protein F7Q99_09370 [Streptomyces kaniharaensis]|uniref:Uncharacterized protein n=1 Tax=Streptomyces kaniharaensis TaxID=212423 RepID=A0A6N7KQ72_9ACTN|nr:hypothetical protein [Streptomyces kaniharaensis]